MNVGAKIKFLREKRRLSTIDLAKLTGISQSVISKLENNKRKADLEIMRTIAETLNVSIDAFSGDSISSIISERLVELNMSMATLSTKAKVSLSFIENLDDLDPFERDYAYVTRIAKVLGVPSAKLRTALARQESPTYDDPQSIADEDFDVIEDDKADMTIAAHRTDDPDMSVEILDPFDGAVKKNMVITNAEEQNHIKKYRALDERGKQTVDLILDSQYELIVAKKETTASSGLSDEDIEKELESYRQELLAEQKGKTSSVSHIIKGA